MSVPTLSERLWPMDAESLATARRWAEDFAIEVLTLTWQAFEQLQAQHLCKVDFQQPLDQLERDLTKHHARYILSLWKREHDGYSTFQPMHEWPEHETRAGGSGKPPAYDLGFVSMDNPRVIWPIEAKVLPKPTVLAEYMGDVEKFIGGTASPFIGEGGLIAYLLSGSAAVFFEQLSTRLDQRVISVDMRPDTHRISFHVRGEAAPALRLHHMAMQCISGATGQ